MARIAGVEIPPNKRVLIGLTYIFGIGRSRSARILQQAGVNPDKKVRDLTDEEITRIRQIIDQEGNIEGDLRKKIQMDIRRLIEIGCYRGSVSYTHLTEGAASGHRAEEEGAGEEVSA